MLTGVKPVKPTHIAVFLRPDLRAPSRYSFHVFAVSKENLQDLSEAFQNANPQSSLIASKKIHASLSKDVEDYAKSSRSTRWTSVGRVRYLVESQGGGVKTAVSESYFPKPPEEKKMKGLGYYVEALCVNHLKKLGVTHVKTSRSPSESRTKQLRKVGLPVNELVEINAWLKAVGKGIKLRLKKKA